VATELDGQLPGGDSWHRDLLDAMTTENARRSRFISPELRDRLTDFLQFRHFLSSCLCVSVALAQNPSRRE
jgi:hypothetical protein